MPSTAWNVFVASGVAVVVYLGLRMGRVLPALVAGTLLFIGGWMTGYAINQGAPISIPRMLIAGSICAFVLVWTLLISPGDYLIGGIVIALVSFAAWFTSEMGPIKGEKGPKAHIDEPKPPAGPRPGSPVDLSGDAATEHADADDADSGFLGSIRDVVTPAEPAPPEAESAAAEAPGPTGPARETLDDHGAVDDDASYSTREVSTDEVPSEPRESIFGLGIFYEGDPDGPPPAGAEPEPSDAEPKDGDHTRPGVSESRPGESEDADDADPEPTKTESEADDGPIEVNLAADGDEPDPEPNDEPTDEPAPDEGRVAAEGAGSTAANAEPTERLREPADSPRRPGEAPATGSAFDFGDADDASERVESDGEASTARRGAEDEDEDDGVGDDGEQAEAASDDQPPEAHRVDIEDGGGFQFG